MKETFLLIPLIFILQISNSQNIDSLKAAKEVDSLIAIANDFQKLNKFNDAIDVLEKAGIIAIQNFGKNSLINAKALSVLGSIYYYMHDFKKTELYWIEVKEIRKNILGSNHNDYSNILNRLGALYDKIEKFDKALECYLEAKSIREKNDGKNNENYALIIGNIGNLYKDIGDFNNAEVYYIEGLKINELISGRNSLQVAYFLNQLGLNYWQVSQLEKAESCFFESKNIREKILGKLNLDYCGSLCNIGLIKMNQGKLFEAEVLFNEVIQYIEQLPNFELMDFYRIVLFNLASTYDALGFYAKEEPFLLRAVSITEKIDTKDNSMYALALKELAQFYMHTLNYQLAETNYLNAYKIIKNKLGDTNALTDRVRNGLGIFYCELKDYKKARLYFEESLKFNEKYFSGLHEVATPLENLANVMEGIGNLDSAIILFKRALDIREKTIGKYHFDYIRNNFNYLNLLIKTNQLNEASVIIKDLNQITIHQLINASKYLSERELTNYVNTFSKILNLTYSFIKSNTVHQNDDARDIGFNTVLFHKNFQLNAINKLKLLVSSDSSLTNKYEMLLSFYRNTASEYSMPMIDRDSAKIFILEKKINIIEKELARKVSDFANLYTLVTWQEVRSKMKQGEVAIEFIDYNYYIPDPTDSTLYAALVLLPGDSSPHFIPLFEEKELNKLLNSTSARKMDYVASVYQSANQRGAMPINDNIKSLYDLIWKPLEPYLKGVKTIYFSPSGLLHRINQNAIAIDDHTLLSDKYDLVQLGSTRQLVFEYKNENAKPISACIYGGINFEIDSTAMITSIHKQDSSITALRSELSFSYTDSTLRGGTWQYLKGSDQEATEINKIFNKAGIKLNFYKGNEATEESFKQLGDYKKESPQILHISTHGYFFPDPKEKVGSSQLAVGSSEPVFKISEHPMMRSGLIMAGANHAWKTGKPIRPDMEDGILTAYEISQLNLRNTELVVLSACETGLGDIQGNEGVYGLQRAFKIAGAKNLIMSLWQVPDQQTNELMTAFYRYWLLKKKSIRQALQLAQKDMRKKGLEPFYWAGFVLVE